MSTQSPDDALTRPPRAIAPRPDIERRRAMALTTRWLRELRGASAAAGDARPAARFTRPVEH